MFLHLSVILFTGESLSKEEGLCQGYPPYGKERAYASYWNAFLFSFNFENLLAMTVATPRVGPAD